MPVKCKSQYKYILQCAVKKVCNRRNPHLNKGQTVNDHDHELSTFCEGDSNKVARDAQ